MISKKPKNNLQIENPHPPSEIRVLHAVHWPNSGITSFLKHFLQYPSNTPVKYFMVFFIGENEEIALFKYSCAEVYCLDFEKNPVKAILKYARLIRKLKPDIIHTHSFQPGFWARIFSLGTGAKIISTIHSPYPYFTGKRVLNKFKRFLEITGMNLRNSLIICVSEGVRRHMAAHTHINSQLVKVVRNGIATRSPNQKDVTAAQEEIKLNGASKIIITAGRLSEEKGLDVLLEAFAQVTQKIAKVHLLILGKGPLEGVVKGLSRKLGLDSSVQLLGFRRDILPYLALSHLYVNSSLYEGLPMSLLEAMAAGLPVIASTVGGIPEVVEGNMTGILVEPGDPQSLADAMLILLKDQALVERLRQNAVKKVAEDFHISQTVKNYENLYLSLMNAGSGYERLGAKD